ncbi:hypothetical protein ACS0TY_017534 [Phlomoides rotata]
MCVVRDFEVKVNKTEVVAAAIPIQDQCLPLSNFDLLSPPEDVAVFFCYTYNPAELSFRHIVQVLKKSLAQTLVTHSFCPL